MCSGSGHTVAPPPVSTTGASAGTLAEQEAYWTKYAKQGPGYAATAGKELKRIAAEKGTQTSSSSTPINTPSATARLGLRIATPKVTVDSLKIPLPVTPNGTT